MADFNLLPALISRESGGDLAALSDKGAAGIMQIMPDTARNPGYGVAPLRGWDGVDPRTAPKEEQIRFGVDYLNAMRQEFGGDISLALAAYNAGPGAVARYGGVPPYKETKEYVKGILSSSAAQGVTPAIANDWKSRARLVPTQTSAWKSRAQLAAHQNNDWKSRAQPYVPPETDDLGATEAALQGFTSVIPFGERIVAGLGAAGATGYSRLTGQFNPGISANYEQIRAMQKATREEHPLAYAGGTMGGIAATLPLAFGGGGGTGIRGAVNAIPEALQSVGSWVRGSKVAADAGRGARAANLAGKAVRSATVAAPTGVIYGYGATDQPLGSSAAVGEAVGSGGVAAALGAAAPVVGAAAGKAIKTVADKLALRVAKKAGEIASTDSVTKEEKKLYDRLLADYGSPDAVLSALNRYRSTGDLSLVEVGRGSTAGLAEASALFPSGGTAAQTFFEGAVDKASTKLKSALGKQLSKSENFVTDLDEVLKAGREKASPLYAEAFNKNQVVQSKIIDRILKTPEGKSALNEAVKNMQNEMALVSAPDTELTALAREAGIAATGQGVGRGLKLRTLDYVKRALDDSVSAAKRAGDDGAYRRINNLRKGLVKELDVADKSGLYAKARAVSGDYLSSKSAMEAGLEFLRTDSELLAKQFSKMSQAEKTAYKAGAVRSVRKDIENKFDGQNVARLFNKESTRQKLRMLMTEKQYSALMKDAEAVDNIYKLKHQVVQGSPTARRTIAAEEFTPELQDFLRKAVLSSPTRALLDKVATSITRQFQGMSDKSAAEVARMLYATEPQEKYQIVRQLAKVAKTKNPEGLDAAKKLSAFYKVAEIISFGGSTKAPDIPNMLK